MNAVTGPDLSGIKRVHVVGVGGPGMGAIAQVLAEMGHRVTGCDTRRTAVTSRLERIGVEVSTGNDERHTVGQDLVSWSPAIGPNHPERVPRHGVEFADRAGVLAAICSMRESIGVAGTHGKTTTSALLRAMLDAAGLEPSFVIGADVLDLGTGAGWRDGRHLVVEADESDGTHTRLPLRAAIVTNVDVDHLDHYGSEEAMVDSFAEMTAGVSGPLVVNGDDARATALPGGSARVTFGFSEGCDVRATEVEVTPGGTSFRVRIAGQAGSRLVRLPLGGRHNVVNSLAALGMAVALGVDVGTAVASIDGFRGVARRLERRGEHDGIEFVDDYAHLPAEIAATLAALRASRPDARIVAVFQPNRYHRVRDLASTYADSFHDADRVVVTDVYASGTEPIPGVSGLLVRDAVAARHDDVTWCERRDELVTHLAGSLRGGDLCVSMGCGDVESLPDEVLAALGARS